MTLKLSADELRYIALFESMTGAATKDCIIDNGRNKIIFVVKKGDMGLAIGKKGSNIQKVKQSLGKKIELVEHSEDPTEFVRNVFHPLRVNEISVLDKEEKKTAQVEMDARDKAQAIGMKGRNLERARALLERHHHMDIAIV